MRKNTQLKILTKTQKKYYPTFNKKPCFKIIPKTLIEKRKEKAPRKQDHLKPPKHRRTNDVGSLNIEVTIGYCKSFGGRFLSHFVRAMELTDIFRISSRIGPSVNACYDFNEDTQQK